jgi:hypothetical protein
MERMKILQSKKPADTAKNPPTIIPEIDNGNVLNLAALIKFLVLINTCRF